MVTRLVITLFFFSSSIGQLSAYRIIESSWEIGCPDNKGIVEIKAHDSGNSWGPPSYRCKEFPFNAQVSNCYWTTTQNAQERSKCDADKFVARIKKDYHSAGMNHEALFMSFYCCDLNLGNVGDWDGRCTLTKQTVQFGTYAPFLDERPEYYLWSIIYTNTLRPNKNAEAVLFKIDTCNFEWEHVADQDSFLSFNYINVLTGVAYGKSSTKLQHATWSSTQSSSWQNVGSSSSGYNCSTSMSKYQIVTGIRRASNDLYVRCTPIQFTYASYCWPSQIRTELSKSKYTMAWKPDTSYWPRGLQVADLEDMSSYNAKPKCLCGQLDRTGLLCSETKASSDVKASVHETSSLKGKGTLIVDGYPLCYNDGVLDENDRHVACRHAGYYRGAVSMFSTSKLPLRSSRDAYIRRAGTSREDAYFSGEMDASESDKKCPAIYGNYGDATLSWNSEVNEVKGTWSNGRKDFTGKFSSVTKFECVVEFNFPDDRKYLTTFYTTNCKLQFHNSDSNFWMKQGECEHVPTPAPTPPNVKGTESETVLLQDPIVSRINKFQCSGSEYNLTSCSTSTSASLLQKCDSSSTYVGLECRQPGYDLTLQTCKEDTCVPRRSEHRAFILSYGFPICDDDLVLESNQYSVKAQAIAKLICEKFGLDKIPMYEISGHSFTSQYNAKDFIMTLTECETGEEKDFSECKYRAIRYDSECKSGRALAVQCAKCTTNDTVNIARQFHKLNYPVHTQFSVEKIHASVYEHLKQLREKCFTWRCHEHRQNDVWCKVDAFLNNILSGFAPLKTGRVMDMRFHHSELLKINFMKEQFNNLKLKMKELGKQIIDFKIALAEYFEILAGYDLRKAEEDKNFLMKYTKENEEAIRTVAEKVGYNLGFLLNQTGKALNEDAFAKSAYAVANLASVFNPLSWLSGGGFKDLQDAVDRVDASAVASARLKKWGGLYKQINETKKYVIKLKEGFATNEVLYKAFLDLINNTRHSTPENLHELSQNFTKTYGNFWPGISRADIEGYTEQIMAMMEELCDLLFGTEVLTAAQVQKDVGDKATCLKLQVSVEVLWGRLEVCFDAQFEIMEAGAEMARAILAQAKAKELAKSLTNITKQDELMDLKLTWDLLFQASVHRVQLIEDACNEIEYKAGGVEQGFCKELRRNPELSMDQLIAYKYDDPICVEGRHSVKVYIPAEMTTKEDGVINLAQLYETGSVTFNIPDEKYLKKYGWIFESDTRHVFYLRQFALYLPSEDGQYEVEVRISHMRGTNRLKSGPISGVNKAKVYLLPTTVSYYTRYGVGFDDCAERFVSPYDVKNCEKLSQNHLCIMSKGDLANEDVLPSVYATFQIELRNQVTQSLKNLTLPKTAKRMYFIAHVDVCGGDSDRSDLFDAMDRIHRARRSFHSNFINFEDVVRHADTNSKMGSFPADDLRTSGRAKGHVAEQMKDDKMQFHDLFEIDLLENDSGTKSQTQCCVDDDQVLDPLTGQCEACPPDSTPALQGYYCRSTKDLKINV